MGIRKTFTSCVHAIMGANAQHRKDCERLSEATGFDWSTFIVMEPKKNRVYYYAQCENKELADIITDELNRQADISGFSTVGIFNLSVRRGKSSEVVVKTKHFITDIDRTIPEPIKGDIFMDLERTSHTDINEFIDQLNMNALNKKIQQYGALQHPDP